MKKGFTLIELLVVVLIIGILSAVALPQYTKSVEKARATEAVLNLKALDNAMQLYIMENGSPTNKMNDLTISLVGDEVDESTVKMKHFDIDVRLNPNGRGYELVASRYPNTDATKNYYLYFAYNGLFYCVARQAESKSVCSTLCSSSVSSSEIAEGYYGCKIN